MTRAKQYIYYAHLQVKEVVSTLAMYAYVQSTKSHANK